MTVSDTVIAVIGTIVGAVIGAVVAAGLTAILQRRRDVQNAKDELARQRKRVLQRVRNVQTAVAGAPAGVSPFRRKAVRDEVYHLGEDNQDYVDAATSPLVNSVADEPIIQLMRQIVINHDLTVTIDAETSLRDRVYGTRRAN
jgi:hypothetical protein